MAFIFNNSTNTITDDTGAAPILGATGAAGDVLTSNGAGAAPTMQAAAGGGGSVVTAHVVFNGTGVVAIQGSPLNVSSITDINIGKYLVNFTAPLPGVNYTCSVTGDMISGVALPFQLGGKTTTTLDVRSVNPSFAYIDCSHISVITFGGA